MHCCVTLNGSTTPHGQNDLSLPMHVAWIRGDCAPISRASQTVYGHSQGPETGRGVDDQNSREDLCGVRDLWPLPFLSCDRDRKGVAQICLDSSYNFACQATSCSRSLNTKRRS